MQVRLKSGRDRPLRLGHPWVFSGALADLDPATPPGSVVEVRSADGELLGRGYANPRCPIAVRMLTFDDDAVDASLVRARASSALALRRAVVGDDTNAYRLIHGEGDGLPGFLVDRYDDVLVVQCLTAGAERLRPWLLEALVDLVAPGAVVERSQGGVRRAEGLEDRHAVLYGAPPGERTIVENGLRFTVPPAAGQKTGHYCDQRPNRVLVRRLARGRRVLDCFCYTGGFSVHAAAGGAARVVGVESSERPLVLARRNAEQNGVGADVRFVHAEAQRFLRDADETYDLAVLDPPALAKRRSEVERGARAYKDLNLWALRRAAPGALLFTFTCSQHVGAELFRKIVLGAAVDAGRRARVLQHLGPGPDHPTALAHPEGEYLHGLLLQVD